MEKSFGWNADLVDGQYDKEYLFEDFANYFTTFFENGYVPRSADALQVIANDDMTVTLKKGKAFLDGYMYENTDDKILQIDPADGVMNRIDRISIVWKKNEKDIEAEVLKGTMSHNPAPVGIRRNADYKDFVVADVLVEAGVISIGQKNITDQRLNGNVCGMSVGVMKQIDTTALYKQIEADLKMFREVNETDFDNWKKACESAMSDWTEDKKNAFLEWFEQMKDQLSEDAAGNLQLQIDAVNSKFSSNSKEIIIVDRNIGDDENGDGTSDSPYRTIQKAVDMYPAAIDSADFTLIIDLHEGDYTDEAHVIISSKKIEFRASRSDTPVKLPALSIVDHSFVAFKTLGFDDEKNYSFQFTTVMKMNVLHTALHVENSEISLKNLSGRIVYRAQSASCFMLAVNSCIDMESDADSTLEIALNPYVATAMFFDLHSSTLLLGNKWSFVLTPTIRYHTYFIRAMRNSFVRIRRQSGTSMTIIAANCIFHAEEFSNIIIDQEIQMDYGGQSPKEYETDTFGLIYPYNVAQIGTTDISSRGDGTVTGAIKYAADLAAKHESELTSYVATGSVKFPSTSIPASSEATLKLAIPAKTGYKLVCLTTGNTGNKNLVFRALYTSNGEAVAVIRNLSTAAVTASSATAIVLYQRT